MVLDIVKYDAAVLREPGARVQRITLETRKLIADMFDTMYANKGIGLAAQQVGRAVQVTVIDVRGVTDRPSSLQINGKPADVDRFMPLVLLNPEITPLGPSVKGPEGCLSFPEVYAEIERPDAVEVQAMNENGKTIRFRCAGLLSRAVQHETDHLHGILFIDRMDEATKAAIRPELEALLRGD